MKPGTRRTCQYHVFASIHFFTELLISSFLRKLLLDEESPEIAQLPRARDTQHRQLQKRPPNNPSIHTLANIPKLRLALALEDLLALHVLQARVQVAHLLDHILNLVLVRALDLRSVADGHVKLKLDAAGLSAVEEEAGGRRHVGGREAEAVIAGVGGGEDEFATGLGALGDDAVVVVEGFVDGYEDALCVVRLWWGLVVDVGLAYHVLVREVGFCLLVPLCCCEVACILLAICPGTAKWLVAAYQRQACPLAAPRRNTSGRVRRCRSTVLVPGWPAEPDRLLTRAT
jgi:hypothetical protein